VQVSVPKVMHCASVNSPVAMQSLISFDVVTAVAATAVTAANRHQAASQ